MPKPTTLIFGGGFSKQEVTEAREAVQELKDMIVIHDSVGFKDYLREKGISAGDRTTYPDLFGPFAVHRVQALRLKLKELGLVAGKSDEAVRTMKGSVIGY